MSTPIQSSFRPGQFWPDTDGVHINAHGGGILHHQSTYYWFGEHKIGGTAGNTAHVGVSCYASADLYSWKNLGTALSVTSDPSSPIVKGAIIERPKVIFNAATRKFVMWFHLESPNGGYGLAHAGVAISDHARGPYRLLWSGRPNAGAWPLNVPESMKKPLTSEEVADLGKRKFPGNTLGGADTNLVFRRDHAGGQMARDMTLFVDDDGKAYHIYSSEENSTTHISLLSDDYTRPSGRYVRIFPGRFHEAPAVFKHEGRYFLFSSDCTGWAPNAARLSVAESIMGTWTELGNPCRGTPEQMANTFESQSTFILPVVGNPGTYIFMGDRWRPNDAIDGRYIWLPIRFDAGIPFIEWRDEWTL